jgi:phospholipid/cholesterol/gamma-HCH transport system ATP-binding protein
MPTKNKNKKKTPKIELNNVYKSFDNNHVLQGVNAIVEPGESLVIIGGSGTGKSVMLKCILGLLEADSGTIKVDGDDITHANRHQRDIMAKKFGMLFQGGALFDSLPVWENVCFGLLQRGKVSRKEAPEIAVEKLRSVGMKPDIAMQFPAELSGGMQKRVALARAIAGEPEIIFFDEPTTGLDPIMADVINDLIVNCTKELGATGLSITHDMASARKIADKIAMIYQGKIIWHGDAKDIDHSGNEHVDQFINGKAKGPIETYV